MVRISISDFPSLHIIDGLRIAWQVGFSHEMDPTQLA